MTKIIFAGTPPIAAGVLQALVANNYSIVACLTQPDRPQGRGLKLTPSAVKTSSLQHGIPVLQPVNLKGADIKKQLLALQADLMIVMAYGLILPFDILQIPRLGCVNLHASILPKWRGAAPIQYSILAGDAESGITIMQMDAGMDTGNILAVYPCQVLPTDTSATLQERLGVLAQTSCVDFLPKFLQGQITPQAQNNTLATYAHKINKHDAKINWADSAIKIDREIRAYNPWPIAFTEVMQQAIRIWAAELVNAPERNAAPGTILNIDQHGVDVATGNGALRIISLQFPGKKVLTAAELHNASHGLSVGARFDSTAKRSIC